MTELILVRHGQANSHATDEASYDKLSELGHQQAHWLGEYLKQTNGHFDHVVTGQLTRHIETADSMGYHGGIRDHRLDEMQYFAMAEAMQCETGHPVPTGPDEFASHLPITLEHWATGGLRAAPETLAEFQSRVMLAISELSALHGRVLIVTSGGVIGMVLRTVLDLNIKCTARVILQTVNSSVHKLTYLRGDFHLSCFNATPHLDIPERAAARTFV